MSTNEAENTKGTDLGIKFYWLGEFADREFLNNEDKQCVLTHTHIYICIYVHKWDQTITFHSCTVHREFSCPGYARLFKVSAGEFFSFYF